MKEHYGVSHWPDEKEIFAKMDRLVNQPLHHIKPEAMKRYLNYFDTRCRSSKAMIEEAKKVIPGGVQHNLAFNYPFPLVITKAEGRTSTTSTATGMWTISRLVVPPCWAATMARSTRRCGRWSGNPVR